MAAAVPDPLPAELTEPAPGDNAWADALADYLVAVATEADERPDAIATELVLAPSEFTEAGAEVGQPHVRRAIGWHIDGVRSAEWAMAKVGEATRQLQQLAEQRDDWTQRIRHWFDQAAGRHLATAAFFTGHLERYALAERERTDGKVKSVPLPSGTIRTTASSAKAVVADEDAVVAWVDAVLADSPEAIEGVAPHSRRVLVSGLRQIVQLVEVVDHADLLLAGGEVVEWLRGQPIGNRQCPGPGDCWPPEGDEGALVAQVKVLQSHLEVRGPDGLPVPGTAIEPATVTARVVLG